MGGTGLILSEPACDPEVSSILRPPGEAWPVITLWSHRPIKFGCPVTQVSYVCTARETSKSRASPRQHRPRPLGSAEEGLRLNVIDEFTHQALAIWIDRKLDSAVVVDVLTDPLILHGAPENIRSHNGPEFIAKVVRKWVADVRARAACIAPGSPWENGFIESFNARPRDELLDGEIFYTLAEARIAVESWRRHCNTVRPHSSLGYGPLAPEVFLPASASAAPPRSMRNVTITAHPATSSPMPPHLDLPALRNRFIQRRSGFGWRPPDPESASAARDLA